MDRYHYIQYSYDREDVIHQYPDGFVNVLRGVRRGAAHAAAEVKRFVGKQVLVTPVESRVSFEELVMGFARDMPVHFRKPVPLEPPYSRNLEATP